MSWVGLLLFIVILAVIDTLWGSGRVWREHKEWMRKQEEKQREAIRARWLPIEQVAAGIGTERLIGEWRELLVALYSVGQSPSPFVTAASVQPLCQQLIKERDAQEKKDAPTQQRPSTVAWWSQ